LVGFARAPLVRFDPFSTQDPIARFVGRSSSATRCRPTPGRCSIGRCVAPPPSLSVGRPPSRQGIRCLNFLATSRYIDFNNNNIKSHCSKREQQGVKQRQRKQMRQSAKDFPFECNCGGSEKSRLVVEADTRSSSTPSWRPPASWAWPPRASSAWPLPEPSWPRRAWPSWPATRPSWRRRAWRP